MVDVWLPYNKTEVCARIPTRNLLGIIEPKEKPGVPDPEAEVLRSLNNPVNSKPPRELVDTTSKVAIVVDDYTRAAPSTILIPPLIREILGDELLTRVRTVSHDYLAKDHVYVGTTKYGTKVSVNKVFANADVRILTGDIEMHYFAGYGGGRKSLLPGICSAEAIQSNHSMILHPKAQTSILTSNPIHEDMAEAAKLAKVDFILNAVTNSEGEIVKVFSGDLEQAFLEGVKLVEEMCKINIDRRADILVVSPGGHPADINLYQAYKAVHNVMDCVKRGGVIILVAECKEGYGNETFYEWMTKYKDLKSMEKQIKKNFAIGGHKAYYLLKGLQKAHIILVSTMPDYYAVNVFKLRTARNVTDALNDAFEIARKNAKIWAIPHGHTTLPLLKSNFADS
jgi:nickel-dependent lactate racemase